MAPAYDYASALLRRVYDKRISGPPMYRPANAYFPESDAFMAAWREIREEALAIARGSKKAPRFHEVMPEQADISANDGIDWRMYIFRAYGIDVKEHMDACPVTAKLLRATPTALTAAFSFLAPGKHIPPHRGPFRGILRYHLMLSMPTGADGRPAASLVIDGSDQRLKDGESLLWDDTFTHEVKNASEEPRIALLLDVKRPNMPADMRLLSNIVVGVVQTGMRVRGVSFGG